MISVAALHFPISSGLVWTEKCLYVLAKTGEKKRCVLKFTRRSVAENMRHDTAMGSPVSVVVVKIVMQNSEEQALATYTRTIPLCLRYVDDIFTAVHIDGIDDFHEHLNRQNVDAEDVSAFGQHRKFPPRARKTSGTQGNQFKEIEENGKIPFLDRLVTRDNNKLQTTIYRKLKHTDLLLDQSLTT